MAKLLSNIRTDVRLLLDETTPADWTAAQVDASINYAYHGIVTAVTETFEDYYITTTTFNSTADQQEYSQSDGMPTDFFKMRRVEINYDTTDTNSTPQRALRVILDDINRDLGNTSVSVTPQRAPAYYLIGSGSNIKLGFLPVPDETGTNAIKIWYSYVVSDLSAATDALDIPYVDRYARLVGYGAAADLLRKGQQEELVAKQYILEYEGGLAKMKQELEDRVADGVRGVTDTVGLNTNFGRTYY